MRPKSKSSYSSDLNTSERKSSSYHTSETTSCNSSHSPSHSRELYFAIRPLFYLRALIHRQKFKALIDSGASNNFISQRIIHQLNLQTNPLKHQLTVKSADGTTLSCNSYTSLKLKLSNLQIRITLRIIDIVPDIVLGLPFLQTYNPIIDWRSRIITIKDAMGKQHQLSPLSNADANIASIHCIDKRNLETSRRIAACCKPMDITIIMNKNTSVNLLITFLSQTNNSAATSNLNRIISILFTTSHLKIQNACRKNESKKFALILKNISKTLNQRCLVKFPLQFNRSLMKSLMFFQTNYLLLYLRNAPSITVSTSFQNTPFLLTASTVCPPRKMRNYGNKLRSTLNLTRYVACLVGNDHWRRIIAW